MTTYVYGILNYFQNGYEPVQLCNEIKQNTIITKDIVYINTDVSDGTLIIEFNYELTLQEKDILDGIIDRHVPNNCSDIEFDCNIDVKNNKILNVAYPTSDMDGVNKIYVDQSTADTYNDSKEYIDNVTSDLVNGIIISSISKININDLQGRPDGDIVGTTANQTLINKSIDAFSNTISNITNANIHDDANIDASKIGNGSVINNDYHNICGLTSNAQQQLNANSSKIDTHIADDTNPHKVTKKQIGLKDVQNTKCNYEATVIPSKFDDVVAGYTKGSIWVNNTTNKAYVCVDNTEIKAVWIELTNIGEITYGKNVGSGEGIYLNKIDTTHNFKSIQGSSNVSIVPSSNEITVKSKDTYSFLLSPMVVEVLETYYTDLLFFPWLQSEFTGYRNGTIIFEAVIDGLNSMSIKLLNVTENSILGEIDSINSSGFYKFPIANPPENARLKLRVKKSGGTGINPRIYGIVLQYSS